MKCQIAHCGESVGIVAAAVGANLCPLHTNRYVKERTEHFPRGMGPSFPSWFATWIQMVDLEMQNALVAPPEPPPEPPKSSYFIYPKVTLPPTATKAGQVQAKRELKEMDLLEAQLALDVVEYTRGRRMELEFELREKRRGKK